MSTSTDYPTGLPSPEIVSHAPKVRAATSGLPGTAAYDPTERDYTGDVDVEFFFNAAQAEEFYDWWEDRLKQGGYWFNCNWPYVRGGASVAQFKRSPKFAHVYDGAHRISATVQIRGASVPVVGCVTHMETFEDGLDGYLTYRGNAGIFSAAGGVLSVASQTSPNAATIYRRAGNLMSVTQFGCEFNCSALTFDDAAAYFVLNGDTLNTSTLLALTPIRDGGADGLRRPQLWWNATGYTLGSAQVPLNTWLLFTAYREAGVGVHWSITNMTTGIVFDSGTLSIPSVAAPTLNAFSFNADAPNPTGPVQYRNCWFSDC